MGRSCTCPALCLPSNVYVLSPDFINCLASQRSLPAVCLAGEAIPLLNLAPQFIGGVASARIIFPEFIPLPSQTADSLYTVAFSTGKKL